VLLCCCVELQRNNSMSLSLTSRTSSSKHKFDGLDRHKIATFAALSTYYINFIVMLVVGINVSVCSKIQPESRPISYCQFSTFKHSASKLSACIPNLSVSTPSPLMGIGGDQVVSIPGRGWRSPRFHKYRGKKCV